MSCELIGLRAVRDHCDVCEAEIHSGTGVSILVGLVATVARGASAECCSISCALTWLTGKGLPR